MSLTEMQCRSAKPGSKLRKLSDSAGVRSCPGWWCSSTAVAEPLATRAYPLAP
jgi:hypothetical protein